MKSGTIIRDILRVDHAGEVGAIRIYRGQIVVARRIAPDLVPFLQDALGDEQSHRDTFARALRERGERPCALLPLWSLGGILLGTATALLGRAAILTCTEAVERTVHRHMDDQIAWLDRHDSALGCRIATIRDEEIAHLEHARAARAGKISTAMWLLDGLVAAAVELLVWVSTYGVSSRLWRSLRMNRLQ